MKDITRTNRLLLTVVSCYWKLICIIKITSTSIFTFRLHYYVCTSLYGGCRYFTAQFSVVEMDFRNWGNAKVGVRRSITTL